MRLHLPVGLTIALLVAAVFFWFAYPLVWIIWASLTDQSIGQSARFIGGSNYQEALSTDSPFWQALQVTVIFAFSETILGIILALATALAIGRVRRSVLYWLAPVIILAFFCPMTTASVAASLIWRYLFDPRYGIVNQLIAALTAPFGITLSEIGWTSKPEWALSTIILFVVWKNFGFRLLVFLAALHAIPKAYLDCARLDGASTWRQFKDIILPLLAPTILFLIVFSLIASMQVFTPVFMITGGGPVDATQSVMLLVTEAMEYGRLGYAAALSVLIGVVIVCLSLSLLIYLRLRRRSATWL